MPQTPALLDPDELAESHGLVRIRERSRGDWTEGETTSGGGIEDGTAKLPLDELPENDSVRRR